MSRSAARRKGKGRALAARRRRGRGPDAPPPREETKAETGRSSSRRVWVALASILVVAFLLRVAYLAALKDAPDFAAPGADAAFHDYWARAMLSGDWTPPANEADPRIAQVPYLRPPGYPYFLAVAYALTGKSYLGARLVQMALGVVNCALVFLLGRSLFRPAVGLIAAALCAVSWALMYFEGELQAPVIIITLSLWLMLLLRKWVRQPRFLTAFGGGMLIGLLCLTRANVMLFIPVAAAWMAWAGRRRGLGRRAPAHVAALVLAAAVAIAPATIRNTVVARDFTLVSCNGAVNLYIGNNETSDGITPSIPDIYELTGMSGWNWFAYDRVVRGVSRREGRELKHSEVSAYFARHAWKFITHHPGRFATLCLKRAVLFWGPREISNNKAIAFEKQNSAVLRYGPGFPFVLSTALAGLGILLYDGATKRGDKSAVRSMRAHAGLSLWLLVLFVVTYFVSFVPFLAAARFRAPLLPLLFLVAAYGVWRFVCLVWRRHWSGASALAAGWLVLLLLAGVQIIKYEPERAWWHTERAAAYARSAKYEEAIREYERALTVNRGYVDGHMNYAALLVRLGRIDGAIAHYRTVARHRPDRLDARVRLGLVLLDRGGFEEAVEVFRGVTEITPEDAGAHANLGAALARLGRNREAIVAYRRVIELGAASATTYYNLATALSAVGVVEEAMSAYERALELNPGYAEAMINYGALLIQQEQYDRAIELCREVMRRDARNLPARQNLAGIFAVQGKIDEAIAELEAALRIAPQDPKTRRQLETLRAVKGHREGDAGSSD